MITFIGLWIGYGAFYLTRNSLTYVAPVMLNDPALGLNLSQVGGLTSVLPLAYGMSKFVSGVLGSRTSPTVLLAGGLMATALVNIAFGFGNAYLYFCVIWAFNGLLQGLGAPACARMLTSWYAGKERGRWWSIWTASNNVGGFAAPILAGSAANKLGWRWGMYAPGIVGIVLGLILLGVTKDSPESAGFPPVEEAGAAKKEPSGKKKEGPSMMESLTNECLKNPYIWAFAIIYFFVYTVRQGVTSWFIFYLLKAKGVQDSATAAVRVSGLELGGLAGSLTAGFLSDKLVARAAETGGGMVGARVKVVMAFSAATVAALAGFWVCPNVAWMQWACVALVGFALYGPQMLIGLCGAEAVSPPSVSACQGFLGWIAYLGAAGAGAPLAMIVQKFGWNALFTTLIGAAGINLVLLAPMINLQSYTQREAAGKTA